LMGKVEKRIGWVQKKGGGGISLDRQIGKDWIQERGGSRGEENQKSRKKDVKVVSESVS